MAAEKLRYRRPSEVDQPAIADRVDEWWGGRRMRHEVRRAWFRHFASTSWLAEADGRPAGFLLGFVAADDPTVAVLHLVGVDPNRRRRGIGRELAQRFADDVHGRGAATVEALVPPEDRIALAFLRSLGFVVDAGSATTPVYGTPAYVDHEGPGEDRCRLVLTIGAGTGGARAV